MISKILTLENFIGIKSGLNRDSITIDLEHLAGDARLVAIVGVNGAGKSTILDNLHPFRVMPSRAGGYSPGSFSYFDNIFGTEAKKVLEWDHMGIRYRTTLVFKMPGKTKKQEAYLHQLCDDSWSPVKAPCGTISDGKTTTYDKVLESVLGTPEMFFTSAFASQGRRALASYGNGEIKSLLSELLGLDHVRDLGKKAKEVSDKLKVRLSGMRGDIERVANAEHEKSQKTAELSAHKNTLVTQTQERQNARIAVNDATRNLTELQVLDNSNTETEIRRQALTTRQESTKTSMARRVNDIDNDITVANNQLATARDKHTRESMAATTTITDLRSNIASYQITLDKKDSIISAASNAPGLEAELVKAKDSLQAKKADSDKQVALISESEKLTERMSAQIREGKALAATLEDLTERSKLVDEVPCSGTEMQCDCQLLANATAARAGIPEATEKHAKKLAEYRETQASKKAIAAQIEEFGDIQAEIKILEADVQKAQHAINENHKLAALADTLNTIEESIRSAESQIASLKSSNTAAADDLEKTELEVKQRIEELTTRKMDVSREANAELETIAQELATLPPPLNTDTLADAERAVEAADQALSRAEQAVESTNTQLARLESELSILERSLVDAGRVKSLAQTVETEISHWSMLAAAFSNDGIISLAIDDAGPTLAALANDLLLACFGPRFSVRLDTQRETNAGDVREAFDITVFDAERDDVKSVSSMSGGEKIWINEAITRAIALYQSQQSGQQYECLFADESDGALDPERKQHLMRMKRQVLEIGGYRSEIFISHTPELWEMADSVINMDSFRQ